MVPHLTKGKYMRRSKLKIAIEYDPVKEEMQVDTSKMGNVKAIEILQTAQMVLLERHLRAVVKRGNI